MWNQRYGIDGYIYGTQPNSFLEENAKLLVGPVLSLAEGEGRNAVFLASLGLDVLGVDGSEVGLAKARVLAKSRGVIVHTEVADLATFVPQENFYGSVVSISCHLPSEIRRRLHHLVERCLKPGGIFLLEGYTKSQLEKNTGGPKDPDLLTGCSDLEEDFPNCDFILSREIEREVIEGEYHSGLASVVQFIAKKKELTSATRKCQCSWPPQVHRSMFLGNLMSTESYFRAMLGLVIFLTVLVTGIHRYKAAQSGEQISRKEEGYLFAIVLRMAGLLLFVTTFAYLTVPASVQWAMFEIPIPVRWIGAIAGLFSSVLMYWTLSSLGKNLTDTVVTRTDATLVTHGPYRWVRHPFYVTTALVMISVTLLTANWLIGFGCLVVLAMLAVRTPKEERVLIERFGEKYLDYMKVAGRFVPRISEK